MLVGNPSYGRSAWYGLPLRSTAFLLRYANHANLAKAFYAKVFNWNFKPAEGSYTEDNIAMFGFEDEKVKGLGGGIVKTEKGDLTQGKGAIKMYLYVYDIEEALEVTYFSLILWTHVWKRQS